ncbi:MAG: hypothetical protein JXA20_08335 [Spirochaetes bacterium]|nr:hypothetical protein [Spirochaetota bacterium]
MPSTKSLFRCTLTALCAAALCLTACSGERDYAAVMAVTGATPIALREQVPAGTSLEVSGLTKQVYRFDDDSLSALAGTYVRTREVSPEGEFLGTYRYSGISLVHLLEGIAPKNEEGAAFDRPLDMAVTFVSGSGSRVDFGYGELTMVDDADAPVLAYSRTELRPNKLKKGQVYDKNRHHGPLKGLRLICPSEPDTGRYLDDVVKIVLRRPSLPAGDIPAMQRGAKCSSNALTGIRDGKGAPMSLQGVARVSIDGWVRTGHGRGYKGISSAQGYSLAGLLKRNFPGAGAGSYFLFVACDGYRVLFSGREIFETGRGKRMMLIDRMDGTTPPGGLMLGPVDDYFVDRDVWGLSHIMLLEKI